MVMDLVHLVPINWLVYNRVPPLPTIRIAMMTLLEPLLEHSKILVSLKLKMVLMITVMA